MYAGAAGRRGGGLHQYGRRPSHARVSAKKHSNSSAATTSNNSIAASASTSRWNNDETFWFWHTTTISNQLYHTLNSIQFSQVDVVMLNYWMWTSLRPQPINFLKCSSFLSSAAASVSKISHSFFSATQAASSRLSSSNFFTTTLLNAMHFSTKAALLQHTTHYIIVV